MFKVKRYISFLLLVCLLPVITPREFIHYLFRHDDTLDVYHDSVTIEKLHKHCSILQYTFSSFVSYLKTLLFEKEFENTSYTFPHQSFIPSVSVHLSSLRAPPSNHI